MIEAINSRTRYLEDELQKLHRTIDVLQAGTEYLKATVDTNAKLAFEIGLLHGQYAPRPPSALQTAKDFPLPLCDAYTHGKFGAGGMTLQQVERTPEVRKMITFYHTFPFPFSSSIN